MVNNQWPIVGAWPDQQFQTIDFELSFGVQRVKPATPRHCGSGIPMEITYKIIVNALIFLMGADWLSLGFHGFALFCIFAGWRANTRLKALEKSLVARPV